MSCIIRNTAQALHVMQMQILRYAKLPAINFAFMNAREISRIKYLACESRILQKNCCNKARI